MKRRNYLLVLVVILILIAIGYSIIEKYSEIPKKVFDRFYCERDSDCVPAQCCHPIDVMNKAYAPDCKDIACTQECRSSTMDCGCGKPVCINYRCEVLWTKNFSWC